MHIAVVSLGAFGHVNPTLELVTELVRRGVRVTYFCTEGFRTIVEPTGAQFVAVPSWMEAHAGESGEDKSDVAATVPFLFLHEAEAYLEPVLAVLKEDRPDAIVHDFAGIAGTLTADELADRFVVQYGCRKMTVKEIFDGRGDLNLVMMQKRLVPHNESFDDSFVFTGVQIGKRTAFGSWKAPADGKPLLYSSLGTAFNNWPEYYPILFDAVRDLDIHVFAALGSIDPASLQDVPANVELGQMVPQLDILSQASVFITHAGMGGTGESIYYGVPMIAIPQMDEQAVTAGQIEKLGLGIAFHGKNSVTSQGLKMAIETILQNDSYRETLQEFSADMRSLGGAKASADALVRFLN